MPKAKTNNSKKASKTNDESNDDGAGVKPKLKGAQKINVRHILCEDKAKKNTALEELRSGKAFDAVAREYSEDKKKAGGLLGWKLRNELIKEFADVAWEISPSTTGKPVWDEVKTSEGYHIIMVEDRK